MKNIIQTIVDREIGEILAESRADIERIVQRSLLPQLRAVVRSETNRLLNVCLSQELEFRRIADVSPRETFSVPGNPEIRDPQPAMGLYLYCLADGDGQKSLGKMGIEANEVYTIPCHELSAVVHACTAEPYHSDEQDKVKGWVLAHQKVVDAAWEEFGAVIPMGFDTIISGNGGAGAEKKMLEWIETDYQSLVGKMVKIRNKAEYGVQIYWETRTMAENVGEQCIEIKSLRREIQTKPRGIAYMYRQKLSELLRKEMSRKADEYFREFYETIRAYTDDLRIEKGRKAIDQKQQMLLNLSCLLTKDQSENLGEALEEIDNREGFSVRYTGPWPPYSFV